MHLTDHAEDYAKEFAGNWTHFSSFAWFSDNQPEDAAENWGIINTTNRDADLITQSNHAALEKALAPFTDDVIPMHMGHWGFGWVDGFAVRVRKREGSVIRSGFTEAFLALVECLIEVEENVFLDHDDLSRREHEASLEFVADNCRFVDLKDDLPDDWVHMVWQWIWDSRYEFVTESSGVWVEEEAIREACEALGFIEEGE